MGWILRWNDEVSGPQGRLHPAGWEIGMTRWRLVVAELQKQALLWHVVLQSFELDPIMCYLHKIFSDDSVVISSRSCLD
jgi:hypothetical protein